jgi:predicted aminopeptidase
MRAEGFETTVYGVPAYSTLGWTNWLGGDPLLNTFISYPEGELARIIFHELAHQVVYAKDDTTFNESYATAVERMGQQRWLASEASDAARADYARFADRRSAFRALVQGARTRLVAIYARKVAEAQDTPGLLAMKKEAMDDFRADYARLRDGWGGDPKQYAGYDAWVANANNAAFGAQAAYDELVPAFEALFARLAQQPGDPWPRFYAEVRRLAALPKAERRAALDAEQPQATALAP